MGGFFVFLFWVVFRHVRSQGAQELTEDFDSHFANSMLPVTFGVLFLSLSFGYLELLIERANQYVLFHIQTFYIPRTFWYAVISLHAGETQVSSENVS